MKKILGIIFIAGFLTILAGSIFPRSQENIADGSGIKIGFVQVARAQSGSTASGSTATTSSSDSGVAGFGSPLSALIAEPTGFVVLSWKVTRGIINILLIIALLAISFSSIIRLNLDNYTIKKALPKLVIGVILANVSMLAIRFMVDINTVATYFFVNQVGSADYSAFLAETVKQIGTSAILTVFPGSASGIVTAGASIFAILIVLVLAIVTIVGLFWLAFLFYFRLIAIYLLTILSPLAFIAYGIPGMEKYFKMWWAQFVKWLFMVPAMSALFWLMLIIGRSGATQSWARLLIMYVIFYTALTLPTKWGGAVLNKASQAFMKYTGANAAKKWSGEQASNLGKYALSRTPVYQLQEWNKLRKENFEKGLANRRAAAGIRAAGGRAGQKRGRLGLESQEIGNLKGISDADIERQAFLRGDISSRVFSSDLKKRAAEAQKTGEMDKRKFELLSGDDNIKKLFADFASKSSSQAAITEAVAKEEMYKIGDFNRDRQQIMAPIKEYKTLKDEEKADGQAVKDAEAKHGAGSPEHLQAKAKLAFDKPDRDIQLQAVEKAFEDAKYEKDKNGAVVKVLHPDLANRSLSELYSKDLDPGTSLGKLLLAEEKRQKAAYTKGVMAKIEDDVKEKSVGKVVSDLNQSIKDLPDAIKEGLARGNTLGVGAKPQKDFIEAMQTLKGIGRNAQDFRYADALKESLNILVKQGNQEIKYNEKQYDKATKKSVSVEKTISNSPTAGNNINISDVQIEKLNQNIQKEIAKAVYQKPAFSGDAGGRVQTFDRDAGLPATPATPPPAPTPPPATGGTTP